MTSTILVIDDDASIVHLLKENLEQEGYKVVGGYDGLVALQLAKSAKPNLIILDVNMPTISGPKTLENLRALPETSPIPVLFLTGEGSAQDSPVPNVALRVAHVKKPIALDDLNLIVRELLTKYPT